MGGRDQDEHEENRERLAKLEAQFNDCKRRHELALADLNNLEAQIVRPPLLFHFAAMKE